MEGICPALRGLLLLIFRVLMPAWEAWVSRFSSSFHKELEMPMYLQKSILFNVVDFNSF